MGKDYYKTLGVEKNATQEEIKKAYRKKAHEFHPDKAGGDELKFKEINEAYQVLGNRQKRAQYDQFGPAFESAQGRGGFSGFEGFRDFSGATNGFNINMDDLGDMFGGIGDIFGFGSGRRQPRSRPKRGSDMQVVLDLGFLEAAFGVEKEISLKKKVKCDRCRGNMAEPGSRISDCQACGGTGRAARTQRTFLGNVRVEAVCEACGGEGKTYEKKCRKCGGEGVVLDAEKIKVKIPAGINEGESIRLSGRGGAGEKGGPDGDLYIRVRVNPDSRFTRDGYDIRTRSEISFAQAALGGKIDVETIYGRVKLKIPAGTQPGTSFKLKGKGVARLRGAGKGDHYVRIAVKTPKSLTRRQKELIKELNL